MYSPIKFHFREKTMSIISTELNQKRDKGRLKEAKKASIERAKQENKPKAKQGSNAKTKSALALSKHISIGN